MTAPLAFLALGSNLNRPHWQLQRAISALDGLPNSTVRACSSIHITAPVGPGIQADYHNAVLLLETALSPFALLRAAQAIERAQGRRRRRKWGPRTLDIDILSHGNTVLNSTRLTIPHPRMAVREFVLMPLLEIAPGLHDPNGISYSEHARKLAGTIY